MAYGVLATVRAMTQLTTTDISDDDTNVLLGEADAVVDEECEIDASNALKIRLSNTLTSSMMSEAVQGKVAMTQGGGLMELVDAFKLDTKSKTTLLRGMAKTFFDRYLYLLSLSTKDSLIKRVP